MPTNVHPVKTMVFPVVIYRCESWSIKKVESWIINAFELWCWKRFLRVPWKASRSNQSILKDINPKCSLEGLTLKLKLQYSSHLMQRADSLEKTLMLGKIEGRRRRGRQRLTASLTQWTWVGANSGRWWRTGRFGMLQFMWSESRTWFCNWTTTNVTYSWFTLLYCINKHNVVKQLFFNRN